MFIHRKIISPYTPRKVFGGGTPFFNPIEADHLWYMPNTLNQSDNIITVRDTGTIGGMDMQNPALANKPIASTIDGKLSYKGDSVQKYLYKATENFARSYPNWMFHFVVNYDASSVYTMLSAYNTANANNNEGFRFIMTNTGISMQVHNASGTSTFPIVFGSQLNAGKILLTFAYTGTKLQLYTNGVIRKNFAAANPIQTPTGTTNLSLLATVATTSETLLSSLADEGLAAFDTYNAAKLTADTNTLKTLYNIA